MTIKETVKKLEHSTTVAAVVELMSAYADDDEKLYELCRELNHDYIIESAGRNYLGYLITVSTTHSIYIHPDGLIIHCERGKFETDCLPDDLERKISRMMSEMYENHNDVEDDIYEN